MLTDDDWDKFVKEIRTSLYLAWSKPGNHHVAVKIPPEDIEKLKEYFSEEDWYRIDLVVVPHT
jgi:hypothetical protein